MEYSGQSGLVVFQCPAQIAQNVIYEVIIISFFLSFLLQLNKHKSVNVQAWGLFI